MVSAKVDDPCYQALAVPCCGAFPIPGDGVLVCSTCGASYSVANGIVRFGSDSGYAANFGLQWRRFSATQVDHLNGTTITRDRLREIAGGDLSFFEGALVYEAGCGAGRYTAVAAEHGARVVAADMALAAVAACRENSGRFADVVWVHADPARASVRSDSVDVAMSIGVYQHTPDPLEYIRGIARTVAPGGRIVFWGYERRWKSLLHPKYLFRPLSRHADPTWLLQMVEKLVDPLLRMSDALRKVPGGRVLARMVPVANYRGVLPLNDSQLREWAILDTFDWLSPRYDRPLPYRMVAGELARLGFSVRRTDPEAVGLVADRVAKPPQRGETLSSSVTRT